MISKSDIIILVLASGALATGVYRWHQNTQDVRAVTIPANSRVVVEPLQPLSEPVETVSVSAAASQVSNADVNTQVIVQTLPEPTPVTEIVVSSSQNDNSFSVGSHTVQSGDYLGKIANQYGTDVRTLRDLNGISGNLIQVGQEILYPL